MAAETNDKPFAIVGKGTLFDGAAYWATLIGVYLMSDLSATGLIAE